MINQIEAFDRLLEALSERGVGEDLSTRDFIEAMDESGLVFTTGSQAEAIAAMDKMDAE
jgi:hypothetical protein